ncbi:hydrolase [Desulfospira joergensenii]|uniref:hydrolase n=1 Tax=Desulfospira joergensenii TaxID=53329 RepID=UPI0003B3E1D1|nr:hydrolase [Desulfospira joergensenii]
MFCVENSVLVLVDVQGRLAQLMYEKERLFTSLETLVKGMKILGVPIIWMEQIPSKLGPTIDSLSKIMEKERPIEKNSFSCCGEPEFMDRLNGLGRNQVLISGIETHICVFQTAFDLLEKGCEVQVVSDCVGSRTLENKEIGLNRIVQSGGQLTCLEMVFFELMKKAQGDAFKQIVAFLK